jgi:hypothetical protein
LDNEEVLAVLTALNARANPLSAILARAYPLIETELSDDERVWLAQEMAGYGVLEGVQTGLPAHARTYRLVFLSTVRITVKGQTLAPLEWPAGHSRLQFFGASLSDLESLLARSTTDTLDVPMPMAEELPPGGPPDAELTGTTNRDQVERILARFRWDFSGLLIRLLGL